MVLVEKTPTASAGDMGGKENLIPGSGRFSGGGHGNPHQYSCLEDPWTEETGGLQFMGLQRVRYY